MMKFIEIECHFQLGISKSLSSPPVIDTQS